METSRRKIFIPRKRTAKPFCRTEYIPEKRQLPVEEILVRILARIHNERRPLTDEPA